MGAHGHATSAGQRKRIFARKLPFWNQFSTQIALNASQILRPFIHTQKHFMTPKQLNSTHPKMTYFTKVLKKLFYSKPQFSPKRFHTQNFWFKTEILITLTHHNNFVNPFKFIKIKLLLFWPIFTKITKIQQLNQTSQLLSSRSWLLNTNRYPTTLLAHKSLINNNVIIFTNLS
jgi:hypothetical protein